MARQLVADNNERSLGGLLMIIVLVALLMATFIHYFFKQEQALSTAGFTALANNFAAKANLVHAQWFMDNQPTMVIVSSMSGGQQQVVVNHKGWIDSASDEFICQNIWQTMLEAPLVFMKSPVSVVEVTRNRKQKGNICQYGLPSGAYFEYNSANGRVSNVMVRESIN
ncbi:MAG: hypothetical protein ACI9LM_000465 [Alteromonadaceae bacterium]|jgi:hypothetical protein